MTIRPRFSGTVPIFKDVSRKKITVLPRRRFVPFGLVSRICPDIDKLRYFTVRILTLSFCSLIMVALCNRAYHYIFTLWFLSSFFFFMAALCNRGPLYFCPVVSFYLLSSSFFSSPNLSGHRLDVYHTSTHGLALVRI